MYVMIPIRDMKKYYCIVFLLMILLQPAFASNHGEIQVDRYSTVDEAPTSAQLNPLLTVVTINFSQQTKTIGDAVNQVLFYSGYELAPAAVLPATLKTVLSKPLPLADRQFNPMTIHEIILILVGKASFNLTQDTINRTVNFHYLGKTSFKENK